MKSTWETLVEAVSTGQQKYNPADLPSVSQRSRNLPTIQSMEGSVSMSIPEWSIVVTTLEEKLKKTGIPALERVIDKIYKELGQKRAGEK